MSSDLHPTKRTRIYPKGLQSPLEQSSTLQRQIGANNGSLCRYICSTLFIKPLLFEHGREKPIQPSAWEGYSPKFAVGIVGVREHLDYGLRDLLEVHLPGVQRLLVRKRRTVLHHV